MFKYGFFSGLCFPAFGRNTERYGVSLRIQSESGKIRIRRNSVFGHFPFRAVIKTLIEEKNATYKIYRHNKDIRDLIYHLQFLQESLSTSTESSKERYYYARISDRLNITQKSTKTHWYLLKIFLNNKKNPAYTTAI